MPHMYLMCFNPPNPTGPLFLLRSPCPTATGFNLFVSDTIQFAFFAFSHLLVAIPLKKVTPSTLGTASLNCQLLLREGWGLRNPSPISARLLRKSTILSRSRTDSHCGCELVSGMAC